MNKFLLLKVTKISKILQNCNQRSSKLKSSEAEIVPGIPKWKLTKSFRDSRSFPVVVFKFGHGDSLKTLRSLSLLLVVILEVIQLLLAKVVDQASSDGVAKHVDGRSESKKCRELSYWITYLGCSKTCQWHIYNGRLRRCNIL